MNTLDNLSAVGIPLTDGQMRAVDGGIIGLALAAIVIVSDAAIWWWSHEHES